MVMVVVTTDPQHVVLIVVKNAVNVGLRGVVIAINIRQISEYVLDITNKSKLSQPKRSTYMQNFR